MDSDAHPDLRLDDTAAEQLEPDRATLEAVGKITEALETVEIARGHLYAFHQLTGSADEKLGQGIALLRDAGHAEHADRLAEHLLGRNVLHGRWTFQIVEEYDATYYREFHDHETRVRELTRGVRHLAEARVKRENRTPGLAGHEATPNSRG
ncbi:hypothetical protein VSH64_19770 [Amycolatopsis rhabdoformis]|uniref:Ferritin-like diiron domain-containing protein n=1 Tax=Amycolatopsis rhabdoformis TaxID=1448059 RepID=A0ABZ1IIM0_9PSEU|nr:hypothetical protein [Amycolatopsis rhabdoformis]WSE34305.1 hypothetical protein VSH64_19770 [Amycolatopsis rhabdoformis]